MPIPAAPLENLPGVEAEGEEDEEMERADAEVFPDDVLRDKMLRAENAIKAGLPSRLRDGGKKLRLSLDAIRRELSRRKLLSEAGAEEEEEKERADAEVRQIPDDVLRDKMLRAENAIKAGLPSRLRDGGKKLRAALDAIRRELARRGAPHPPGGGGGRGARVQDEKAYKIFLRSRCAEPSGMRPRALMPMAVVPTESVFSNEVEAEEKERADAEVQQLPDHALREKKLRAENLIKGGLTNRLPDGGKKLCASLDAIFPELSRRKRRSEAPHPHGCSGGSDSAPVAWAQGEKGCERIVRSRCAESSGTGPRAYVSRRVMLCSVLKAIKGSEALFRSVACGVPDRFAMEVYAEAPWRGVPGNVRCLKAMSGLCDSVEEAEESAANNLVAILQKEYGVVVDDFNYAALCMEGEKKKYYRAAAKAFESGWKKSLDDMESMQEKCEEICVDAMADFPRSDVTSSFVSLVEWSEARLWEGLAYHEEFKQKYL